MDSIHTAPSSIPNLSLLGGKETEPFVPSKLASW